MSEFTAAHWGIYEIDRSGATPSLRPLRSDPDPSPIGLAMLEAGQARHRVLRPAVRLSWLREGPGAAPERRGLEPFVQVEWDEALDLAARAIRETIARMGNSGVYASSYGWSSAGRFHHAQSQIHRFFNTLGGYVRHTDSYSLAAGRVLLPHVVAPMDTLLNSHTSWEVMARHTRLFVSFGGVPAKNAQISQGLAGDHTVRRGLRLMEETGMRFVNVSPVSSDLDVSPGKAALHEWIAVRPNTDTALMLALAYTLQAEGLHDEGFLARCTTGFERFLPYLRGTADGTPKTPEWAAAITGVPAERIRTLAREMAAQRTMLTVSWSLQRAHHGEQPFWALITLAAMLGQIGLPGGGFGLGYGASNGIGNVSPGFSGPTLSQGRNPVADFIPVARLVDMLERPGDSFSYDGQQRRYPHIGLVYWAGGNPFHHHQDLNRLLRAWRRPAAVIVNEQFWTATAKLADIVLPATTTLERDDMAFSSRERYLVAMKQVVPPAGEARDDHAIFAALAERLGVHTAFTENRRPSDWLRHLYAESRERATAAGVALPEFDAFWAAGLVDLKPLEGRTVMLEAFRRDPATHPLKTPSGKIEIFSEAIAGFGYADCGGHARWYEPVEWLGSEKAASFPLHMVSDQPFTKLHSQLDHSAYSQANKIAGREPVTLHPDDAARRGIAEGDIVRVFNARGACLAGARLSRSIRPGVIKLSTGAWFDPVAWGEAGALEKHGNPNTLTLDEGASSLSQGCIAQTCLVEVETFKGPIPPLTAFVPPAFAAR